MPRSNESESGHGKGEAGTGEGRNSLLQNAAKNRETKKTRLKLGQGAKTKSERASRLGIPQVLNMKKVWEKRGSGGARTTLTIKPEKGERAEGRCIGKECVFFTFRQGLEEQGESL